MNTLIIFAFLLLSYLLGSIPFGLLIGKTFKGIDIRSAGSKSTGATNTMRLLGWRFGLLTLFLDSIKGIIVIVIVRYILNDYYMIKLFNYNIEILGLYGIAAVLGHVFSIYIGFKGGKAVATSYGILMILTPLTGLAATIVFALIVKFTKYVSLASIVTSLLVFVISLFGIFIKDVDYIRLVRIETLVTYMVLVSIIYIRHKANIERLQNGTENKINIK
ncbi:MAG TPA: glycerol-3-phosphate 1-O-acyltransferase PlsY [Acholeplasma sp.]|jgi:glycerol-3-phosphate acyltransferase PlsY|nr:glycerol-3-phosphate 1-O-acyltransferase PlsY [Acholeplasma sp.]